MCCDCGYNRTPCAASACSTLHTQMCALPAFAPRRFLPLSARAARLSPRQSYVNLAIFDPGEDRSSVREAIGDEAEALVHKLCVIPRHQIVWDDLAHPRGDEPFTFC